MGNYYVNHTLKGVTQHAVVRALGGRRAYVSPESGGYVVVYDEDSDSQTGSVVERVATMLSASLKCVILTVLVHDDDILYYELRDSGKKLDEYDSSPDYYSKDTFKERRGPTGGDAVLLCKAFLCANADRVEQILRRPTSGDDRYLFEYDRHQDLCKALGHPPFAVASGFQNISEGDLPEDLTEGELIHIEPV